MNYQRITMAKPATVSRLMMTILNNMQGYRNEDRLLALYAVCEIFMNYAQTTMEITRHDLCQLLENMDVSKESMTRIARTTIERMILENENL